MLRQSDLSPVKYKRVAEKDSKEVSWEQAKDSKLDLWPKQELAFGPFPTPPVAVPGKDPLV